VIYWFEGVRPKAFISTSRININNRLIKLNNVRDFTPPVRDKKHENEMTNGSLSVLYVLALLGFESHAIKMEFLRIEFQDLIDLRHEV
jgi:hypothetical protein